MHVARIWMRGADARVLGITLILMCVLPALLTTAPVEAQEAGSQIDPQPVIATPAREMAVAADGGYLAWQVITPKERSYILVRTPEGDRFRVASRVNTALGDIDGGVIAYQEYQGKGFWGYERRGSSRIRLMDLETRKDVTPGWLDRSKAWEYTPGLHDKWLMFGQVRGARRELVLTNLRTRNRRIEMYMQWDEYLDAGQINGSSPFAILNWAEWPGYGTSSVYWTYSRPGFLDNWTDFEDRDHVWAPSVSEAGEQYMVRDRNGCGNKVRLMRELETLIDLPPGTGISHTYVAHDEDGISEVYYVLETCGSPNSDIFMFRDGVTADVVVSGNGTGSVSSEPAAITCGSVCSAEFPRLTQIKLTADPDLLSHFAGWTGACEGQENPCVLNLEGDVQAGAVFDLGP
jgi:Divergent InlB B-repeat domain